MGSSCFFLDKAASDKRPAAPFPRTTISLVGATRPYVLQRNRVAVPPDEAKKYLFFDTYAEQIGAYPLALHHSIPFNLLKSSWDPILLFCTPAAITALWAHYCQAHPTLKESPAEIKSLTKKLLEVRTKLGLPLNYGGTGGTPKTFLDYATAAYAAVDADKTPGAMTSDEINAMTVILCWGAWNLTEGPEGAIRIEDPGEAYDEFCNCCPSEIMKVRYRAVARLNVALLHISAEYERKKREPVNTKLGQDWSAELMEALRLCQALDSEQRKLVYVDPLMWAPVANYGPVDLNKVAKLSSDSMMKIEIQSKWYWRQYKCGRYK